MADRITLTLQPRDTIGKKVKALRHAGIVPVHLYGPGITSQPLQCEGQELIRVLTQAGGNTPVSVTVAGKTDEHLAFVRETQWDPIRGELLHVDFLRAEATQRLSAEVPIVLFGESPGARAVFGSVMQQLHSATIEALPLDMPADIRIDLSTLAQPDHVIRTGDIPLPAGATLVNDPEEMVARIEVARAEVEEGAAPALEPETEADDEA